jgi:hypothetical protein
MPNCGRNHRTNMAARPQPSKLVRGPLVITGAARARQLRPQAIGNRREICNMAPTDGSDDVLEDARREASSYIRQFLRKRPKLLAVVGACALLTPLATTLGVPAQVAAWKDQILLPRAVPESTSSQLPPPQASGLHSKPAPPETSQTGLPSTARSAPSASIRLPAAASDGIRYVPPVFELGCSYDIPPNTALWLAIRREGDSEVFLQGPVRLDRDGQCWFPTALSTVPSSSQRAVWLITLINVVDAVSNTWSGEYLRGIVDGRTYLRARPERDVYVGGVTPLTTGRFSDVSLALPSAPAEMPAAT